MNQRLRRYSIVALVGLSCYTSAASLPPAPDDQERPAVAASSNSFFVVWSDKRDFGQNEWDVYGARVSFTGELLDPGGIPICTLPGSQYWPTIAFDGDNFLVIWWHAADDGSVAIFGARVTPEGRVLDPNGFRITSARSLPTPGVVGSNGRNFFVSWPEWFRGTNVIADVYGTPVSKDGVVANPDGIPLHAGPWWQIPERIVSANGEYLIVYFNNPGVNELFWGIRVAEDGTVLGQGGFPISSDTAIDGVGLATDGQNYFVSWTDYRVRQGDNYRYAIYGTLVTAAGQVLSPGGVRLAPETFDVSSDTGPAVGSDGEEFLVSWLEDLRIPDLYGAKVTAAGNLGTPARFPISSVPGAQRHQQIAFAQGNYLVVWDDGRSEPDDPYPFRAFDIYATLVSPSGVVASPDGVLVSTGPLPPVAILNSQQVISPNNQNATVRLDGSASWSPSGRALAYSWFIDFAMLSGASNAIIEVILPVGHHAVLLEVDDGLSQTAASATVTVVTASDATLALLATVRQSTLRHPIKAHLEAILSHAAREFQRGRFAAGDASLAQFQRHVQSRVQPADPALATQLISEADRIRQALRP